MGLTSVAGPRPTQGDYHLWCEKMEFSPIMVCLKCGLTVDSSMPGAELPMYGCPGKNPTPHSST